MAEIYAYARVSTQEQAENSHALEQQIDRLNKAGATKIYSDVVSGAKTDKPQFMELMDLVRQGKVKKLIATRWDRLMRNEEVYLEFKQLLQSCGTELQLLDQGTVDFNTAAGELSADMQALFAVHERRMLRERVKHGFKHRRQRLAAPGRAPFGFTITNEKYQLNTKPCICLLEDRPTNYLELYAEPDNSERLLNRSKAQIAKEIFEFFLKLKKPRKVLSFMYEKYGLIHKKGTNSALDDELSLPKSTTHLREWLLNPVHQGHTAYLKYKGPEHTWELHRDTHPQQRLIDETEAEEIKELLKLTNKRVGSSQNTFYLTGLVFCNECGGKCMLRRNHAYRYYVCRYAKLGCSNIKGTRLENIERAIIDTLFRRALALSQTPNLQPDFFFESAHLKEMEEQLAQLEQIPGLEKNPFLQHAKNDLLQKIEKEKKPFQTPSSLELTNQQIINHPQARNLNFWYGLTIAEREILYDKLVEKVLIFSTQVSSVTLHV